MAALDYNHLFFDDAKGGAPYYLDALGGRSYLSPAAAAQVRPSQAGDDPAWDKNEAAIDWTRGGVMYWIDANGQPHDFAFVPGVSLDDALRAHAWALGNYGASVGAGTPYTDYNPTGDVPGSSLFKERGEWNPDTGQYDQGVNWNNIVSIGVGTFLTFGAIDAFTAGGAAAASGGSTAVAGGSTASAIPATAGGSLAGGVLTAAKLGSAALSTALGIKAATAQPKPLEVTPQPIGGNLGDSFLDQLNDPRVKLAIAALVVLAFVKGK